MPVPPRLDKERDEMLNFDGNNRMTIAKGPAPKYSLGLEEVPPNERFIMVRKGPFEKHPKDMHQDEYRSYLAEKLKEIKRRAPGLNSE